MKRWLKPLVSVETYSEILRSLGVARPSLRIRISPLAFFTVFAILGTFVVLTAQRLPPLVASHFAASGSANRFMPRESYTVFIVFLQVGVPLLLAFLPPAIAGLGGENLSIPNQEYWLAPERREATIEFLCIRGRWFAVLVSIFLCYLHWLVVLANAVQPPVLPPVDLIFGLIAFMAALVIWLRGLLQRFRNVD